MNSSQQRYCSDCKALRTGKFCCECGAKLTEAAAFCDENKDSSYPAENRDTVAEEIHKKSSGESVTNGKEEENCEERELLVPKEIQVEEKTVRKDEKAQTGE